MKPLSLKLRGATGIYEGLGLDEISIDFTKFESGLIALVGPNGSGKTTLLESFHPYLQLASREGSLSNHFRLRDSFRDLTFELQGHVYRAHILIDAQTAKTEAYLYRDGQPLNDGKVTTYKPEIEKLLGSAELFFRSIFSSQKSESITSLTAGKRKELFIELLGLQRYERYEALCKVKVDELENVIAGTRGKLDQIYQSTSKRSVVEEELSRLQQDLIGIEDSLKLLQNDIDINSKLVLDNERRIVEDKQRGIQIHDLGNEISVMESQQWKMNNDFQVEGKKIVEQIRETDAEIRRKEKIVEHKKEIEENVVRLKVLRPQLKAWDERKTQLLEVQEEENIAQLEHLNKVHEYQKAFSVIDNEIKQITRQIEESMKSSELIKEVPCNGMILLDRCKLLSSAREAQNNINTLETQRNEWIDRRSQLQQPSELDLAEYTSRKRSIDYDADKHSQLKKEIEELEKGEWEKLVEELRISESVIEEKKKALNELAIRHQELQDKHGAALAESEQRSTEKRKKWNELKALMITQKDMLEFDRVKQTLSVLLGRQKEAVNKRSSILGDIQFRQNMIKELDELTIQAKELDTQLLSDLKRLESYRLLQRAFSKDGIPALELDAAGPEISRIANELLASTFGSRYQIAFETTKLTKDKKKQVETFEIRVYGEDGEKKIEDLSGGERVWIETALQEAIAIYLSEKSGKELLTSYQDEKDGALDPDNKQHFIEMSREAFRLGRRYYTFVITQTPDIWQQIQQRIVLHPENGTIEQII